LAIAAALIFKAELRLKSDEKQGKGRKQPALAGKERAGQSLAAMAVINGGFLRHLSYAFPAFTLYL